MNKIKKTIVLLASLFVIASCGAHETSNENNCSLTLTNLVNKPLANASVKVYNKNNKVIKSATTNENGEVTLSVSDEDYTVKFSNLPDGYYQNKEVVINNKETSYKVKLPSKVIESPAPTDLIYTTGDVVHDFVFTDCYNNEHRLTESLKTKDVVILNFWATWCSPCAAEFPFLDEAYQSRIDKVDVFAMTNANTNNEVKAYKETYGYSFPMGYDFDTSDNFGISSYPITIAIDRYGMVMSMHRGNFVSITDFLDLFDRFIGPDYIPSLANENGQFIDMPDVSMPNSSEIEAVVNGEGFSSSFYPETNEADAPYTWPWIISSDGNSIVPSNSKHGNSFATIYTTITLDENKVFAFDYKADTERNCDILYVLIDREIVQQISGKSTEFEKCYCYVPLESGTHEVAFCYVKDNAGNSGEDTVYVNNLRIISTDRIDQPTYIFHKAYYGYNNATQKYTSYVPVVKSSNDNYYHVYSENGPLLLANLMSETGFSSSSIYSLVGMGNEEEINPEYRNEIGKYCQLIRNYASYQNNSEVSLVPVTEELKIALVDITTAISKEDNRWLETCAFYSAYNTDDIKDPIKGLAPFSAYEGKEGINVVNINRLIMPKGLLTKFVPTKSSVYHFYSFTVDSQLLPETQCWLVDEDMRFIAESTFEDRYYSICKDPDPNFSLYAYLEAGKTYYLSVAFCNLNYLGDIPFAFECMDVQEYSYLSLCSPNFFTTVLDDKGEMTNNVIAGGINVQLGNDGYYHELREDGSLGSLVYADFYYGTGLFTSATDVLSLKDMIDLGAFNFTVDEEGNAVEGGVDKTNQIAAYLRKVIKTESEYGLVPVDANLANLLQELMEKYTFKNVENSWTKLCYYYKVISNN